MRYAIITKGDVEQVKDYLPSNYSVVHVDPNGQGILIAGEDDHGWTMDDYVLPRLGSALIVANEVWPLFSTQGTGPVRSMDVPFDWLRLPLHRSGS
jgi:hypothetical protein